MASTAKAISHLIHTSLHVTILSFPMRSSYPTSPVVPHHLRLDWRAETEKEAYNVDQCMPAWYVIACASSSKDENGFGEPGKRYERICRYSEAIGSRNEHRVRYGDANVVVHQILATWIPMMFTKAYSAPIATVNEPNESRILGRFIKNCDIRVSEIDAFNPR